MRDVYLNDIGDYVKYALLRRLSEGEGQAGRRRRLGVLWYLTVHDEPNNDGCHRGYLDRPEFAGLDARLFDEMCRLEEQVVAGTRRRGVDLLEPSAPGARYLPGARLHPVPLERMTRAAGAVRGFRQAAREAWWADARRAVAGCDVVFLDPDNGLRPRGVDDGHRDEPKFCRRAEVVDLVGEHELVVVYQHANRSPWDDLRSGIVEAVRDDLRSAGLPDAARVPVHTLVASTFGRRGFICFARDPKTADDARAAIEALITRAAGGPLDGKLTRQAD